MIINSNARLSQTSQSKVKISSLFFLPLIFTNRIITIYKFLICFPLTKNITKLQRSLSFASLTVLL